MTLNYFSKSAAVDGKRYDSVNTVRTWLARKAHLPADLRRSLEYLIPELTQDSAGAWDDDFSQ